MKTKDRLAYTAMELLRIALAHAEIYYEDGMQQGGGTINSESLIVGKANQDKLLVAITSKGKFEVCDDNGDHRLFGRKDMGSLLQVLRRGALHAVTIHGDNETFGFG